MSSNNKPSSGKYIPFHKSIKDKLKRKFEKELKFPFEKIIEDGNISKLTNHINEVLRQKYEDPKSPYRDYLQPYNQEESKPEVPSEFISRKGIERYFLGENKKIHSQKLVMLLAYLNYEPESFDSILGFKVEPQVKKEETANKKDVTLKEDSYIQLISGAYLAFVFDSTAEEREKKVRRTPLWLEPIENSNSRLKVEYRSVWDNWFSGEATIRDNSLTVEMYSDDRRICIYLVAALPKKGSKNANDIWILNAAGITNGRNNQPAMARLILVKSNKPSAKDKDNFMKKRVKNLTYEENPPKKTEKDLLSRDEVNQIITYLSRHQDESIGIFTPNTFNTIEERNKEFEKKNGRDGYLKLKTLLDKQDPNAQFYSFNRALSEHKVAIFAWNFVFLDVEHKCLARRTRIGHPSIVEFEGEVTLENYLIFMQLRDKETQRRKLMVIPFPIENNNKLYGITASVTTQRKPLALRELIIFIQDKDLDLEPTERINGNIDYKKFIKLSGLSQIDKLYLANPYQSTLSYPDLEDKKFTLARQQNGSIFSGLYDLYIPNYDTPPVEEQILLRGSLEIDELAQVTLQLQFSEDGETQKYQGQCEFYHPTLRMGLHLAKSSISKYKYTEFVSEFIKFDHGKPPRIIKGILLTTNDNDFLAVAKRFIAVRIDNQSEDKPAVLLLDKSNYKDVCDHLFSKGIDIKDFFYNLSSL